MPNTRSGRVLVVDDQAGDIVWLLDLITSRGYKIDLATNQDAAKEQLDAVKAGKKIYDLAVFDIMVAVKDLMELSKIDEKFFEDSRDTGIRLCQYARGELDISEQDLPIVCLSVRDDDEVKEALKKLDIPLFNRAQTGSGQSIRQYILDQLPVYID